MDFNLFIPISKVDVSQRLVYGTMSQEVPDSAGEIMDYESGKPHFQKWSDDALKRSEGKSKGNVRSMHSSIAAGKLTDISFDDINKRIDCCAKIIDDNEWEKVLEGVHTGFSIGGSYAKRWRDPNNSDLMRFTPIPSEVSIVDNPCCPTATFSMVKADGSVSEIVFKHKEQIMDKDALRKAAGQNIEQGWLTKDHAFYAKRDDAIEHEIKRETAALVKRDFFDKKRKELADKGHAMPDGSFPIESEGDLKNAVRAVGRAKDPEKAKAHITARAKDLKATHLLPAEWEGSTKNKEEEKVEKRAAMQKGMQDIARVACLIAQLDDISEWVHFEEAMEQNEDSEAPSHLEEIVKELCDWLQARVEEETGEIVDDQNLSEMAMEMAAGLPKDKAQAIIKTLDGKEKFKKLSEALSKAGARHSKGDMEHGEAIHKALSGAMEHMAEVNKCMGKLAKCHEGMQECHKAAMGHAEDMGFDKDDNDPDDNKETPASKSVATEELKKMLAEAVNPLTEALKKSEAEKESQAKEHAEQLKKAAETAQKLEERLKKIEAQPMPGKGAVFDVHKGHERAKPETSAVETTYSTLNGLSPAERFAHFNSKK